MQIKIQDPKITFQISYYEVYNLWNMIKISYFIESNVLRVVHL